MLVWLWDKNEDRNFDKINRQSIAMKYANKIYYKELSREDSLWVLKQLGLCRKEVK